MSKQPPPAPTARAVGPCPTLIQTSRTPRHWKFIQDHRTTRPPPQNVEKHMELKKSNSAGDVENVKVKDIEILKSDMKTVGTVLDKFLDQLGKSSSSLDNQLTSFGQACRSI